ncbi:enoyl-CoA hydratase/isomerase family protein [Salinadaptatus halalkaliphilus]|uniref:Enoyl-CoA hydratase/isomerase family protein n=1 Tax=Salinadaptatus halalkaliphilus TaxID=2419781 RepID=A0A4S3TGL8_9EURY|nr:enoyl-CoA hydratase/isomerase family protein [Salinadaptatus halalkaliphilus]THE63016.1 enoyl-CoA hydratase/isomerase family protein [Salinadaptatus halalkaliphilus]
MATTDNYAYETDGNIGRLTLDRPDVLNAISGEFAVELESAFRDIDADDDISILHLTGRGDSFCSGFDIGELEDDLSGMSYENYERHVDGIVALQNLSRMIRDADTVVVAEVTGNALGAGLELAVISDIAIAADDARFGFPETNVGLSITNGVTNLLPRAVGLQRAKLLTLTGEYFSGRDAADMGLIAESVPEAELSERVETVIESVLSNSGSAVAATKALLNCGSEVRYEESLEREHVAGSELLRSEEYKRMVREFVTD